MVPAGLAWLASLSGARPDINLTRRVRLRDARRVDDAEGATQEPRARSVSCACLARFASAPSDDNHVSLSSTPSRSLRRRSDSAALIHPAHIARQVAACKVACTPASNNTYVPRSHPSKFQPRPIPCCAASARVLSSGAVGRLQTPILLLT
ncbi:hypothetical protein BST61_g9104 [Cercospora zeina]